MMLTPDARPRPRFRVIAFLQCTSCRFAAFYFLPFWGGLAQSHRTTLRYGVLGALFWLFTSLGIELTNRLSDRPEDAVNREERTALCNYVGWRALTSWQWIIWGVVLAIDIGWIVLAGNPVFIGMLLGSSALGIAYSRGPRLSRKRRFAFISLNLLFGGAFMLGWSIGDPFGRSGNKGWSEIAEFMPLIAIVGVFMLALGGIKDITDRVGDRKIGYRSVFVDLVEHGNTIVLGLVASTPFITTATLTALGLLPGRLLVLLCFVPVSAIIAASARKARTEPDRLLCREAFYGYWLAFVTCALLLFRPNVSVAVGVAGTVAYWTAASHWLHWTRPLGLDGLMRVGRMAFRKRDGVLVASTRMVH